MQVTNVVPFSRTRMMPRSMRRNTLGQWESLIPLAAQFVAGSGNGAPSGGGAVPGGTSSTSIGVSPVISVSPQISPVFQQQFQPSGSPISAGTSQVAPALPSPPSMPGTQYPGYNGALLPTGYPQTSIPVPEVPRQDVLAQYLPWILGGAAVITGVVLFMRYRKKK
jgi:hypothetical protein